MFFKSSSIWYGIKVHMMLFLKIPFGQ